MCCHELEVKVAVVSSSDGSAAKSQVSFVVKWIWNKCVISASEKVLPRLVGFT